MFKIKIWLFRRKGTSTQANYGVFVEKAIESDTIES